MQRWIASAAGGTSQRLKRARAMMRLRSSRPIPEPGESVTAPIAVMIAPLTVFAAIWLNFR